MKLSSKWIFWHASRKEENHHIKYSDRLTKLAEITSLKDFFTNYLYLKNYDELERNNDLALFKEHYTPTWESCPKSACLFIRFKKFYEPTEISLLWEKMLFAVIGEQFDTPHILGVILSIRGRETILELWFDYFKNDELKIKLVGKMKTLLDFDDSNLLYFKDNEQSLQDYSTLRNAETYSYVKKFC